MAGAALQRLRWLIPGTSGHTMTALRQAVRCWYYISGMAPEETVALGSVSRLRWLPLLS